MGSQAPNTEIEKRELQQRIIAQLGVAALHEPDMQVFIKQTLRKVRVALSAASYEVLEIQPGTERMLVRARHQGTPLLMPVADRLTPHAPVALLRTASTQEKPLMLNANAVRDWFQACGINAQHLDAILCAIPSDSDKAYGVFAVYGSANEPFTEADSDFLHAVAAVLGAKLNRYLTRLRFELEQKVASVFTDKNDITRAEREVCDKVRSILEADHAELWQPTEEDFVCSYLAHTSPTNATTHTDLPSNSTVIDKGLVGSVFQSGRSVWCTDLGDPGLFDRAEMAKEHGLVSGLAIPISFEGSTQYVLTLYSRRRYFADEWFLRSLEGIGQAIGEHLYRLKVQSEIALSAERKESMLQAALDAIITITTDGRVVEFNAAAESLFGYRIEEAVGRELASLIIPERLRDAHRAGLTRLEKTNEHSILGRRVEVPAIDKNGRDFWVELTIARINERGTRLYMGFARDITDRREAEQRLREADEQKDMFLAMLGHELRNPLAAISACTELLSGISLEETALERATVILRRQTRQMTKLLDGLLDVSRIIRGKIDLDLTNLDLRKVCAETVADHQVHFKQKKVSLAQGGDTTKALIYADLVRVRQIVDNLLTNALKFTPPGGQVFVEVTTNGPMAVLRIVDNGTGIEPSLLPFVFDTFRQGEQSTDRAQGGLGIGLALVRLLVELHNGCVCARSEGKDSGTEFEIHFPKAGVGEAITMNAEAPPQYEEKLRVLLIEDNRDAADALGSLLDAAGHEVRICHDGLMGLEVMRKWPPDVVLCDLGLPNGCSGFDVANRLREDPNLSKTRLIALSGYGRPEDKARSKQAGFDFHLTKPTTLRAIEEVFADLLASD